MASLSKQPSGKDFAAVVAHHANAAEAELAKLHAAGILGALPRPIRSRADLSFVGYASGHFRPWHIEPSARPEYWGNGFQIGQAWFAEVARLAAHDAEEAMLILEHVYETMDRTGAGLECGFMQAFATAAVRGILAYPGGVPAIVCGGA